ncbi:WD40 repeat protein [Ichthyophthirius multifiliis]|uniref:WD40 repeat protein n=1 Tax=Ichthyophthirius multifiliis TaxID=5932 RepID=G0QXS6_ICHMU|nr:WD40 repeat protein [Ichthyophthirius multifiliis]EGR29977.1 WD40 repeat protein [Ichthyophthirius multifiliis]|eukprot:XP_004031213.1 WD40 repeat protein [Ichthyophthirius multifiliis]
MNFLITGGAFDKLIKVWDINTHKLLFQLKGHDQGVWDLHKFSGLDLVVSAGMDKSIKIWNAKKGGPPLRQIPDAHKNWIRGLLYIPESDGLVASSSYDKTVKVWNVQTGELVQEMLGHEADIYALTYEETTNQLISCDNKGNILRWNWLEGSFKVVQQDQSGFFAIGITTIPNSKLMFTVGYNSFNIFALDISKLNKQPLYVKKGHANETWNVKYRKGTGFIYSGSTDYSVKKWNVCEFLHEIFDLEEGICVKECKEGYIENSDLNICVKQVKKSEL